MSRSRFLWVVLALGLVGCSAIVEFERSRLVDAGVDASADSGVTDDQDASVEASASD